MAKLVPSRGRFRDVRRMDVCRDSVPLVLRVGGPVRLLQIPPAVPVLSILSVRTRVLIDREYSLSADDPADVAHHLQLFRRVQVVERKTDPYDADRIAPILERLDKVALVQIDRTAQHTQRLFGDI